MTHSRLALFVIGCALSALAGAKPPHNGRASFRMSVVAGKPDDLMTVRHVVIRGSNEQIGKALAQLAIRNHGAKLMHLSPSILGPRMTWFRAHYPEIVARAGGVRSAEPGGVDEDYSSLPYDFDIQPGCSVVFYPPRDVTNHHAMLSRNYDFHKGSFSQLMNRSSGAVGGKAGRSFTGDPYVIEVHPDHGYAALYTCSYDLLGAIDGVNEKGMSVALLADDLSTTRTRGTPYLGLGEVGLPRYILDKAASARQARRLLQNAPVYAVFGPIHYIVSDASSDSFVFEVDEHNVHHIFNDSDAPQVITNHALTRYGTRNLPKGDSFDRYRKLETEIASCRGRVTPEEVKNINHAVAVPGDLGVSATMWHAVYDLTDRSLKISFCLSRPEEKTERRSPYLSFRLGK